MRALAPGTIVGRYRIVKLLGRGGMGAVYEAKDEQLGRSIALKVVSEGLAAEERFLRRFAREGRAGAAVRNAHVAVVHEAGSTGGVAMIAMELLPGGSLADRLKTKGAFPWPEAAGLGVQIATGLAAIHAAGFVHRDLKPENVLLDESGTAKITDLGLVGHDTEDRRSIGNSLTKTGELLGTLAYMAPEQAEGTHVDARADLYALGALLHALITGAPPFQGTGYALVRQHLEARPPSVRDSVTDVPRPLSSLILRLLDKDPARRGDARSVAVELDAIARGKTTEPGHGRPLLLGAVVVAIGAALGVGVLIGSAHAPPAGAPPPVTLAPTPPAPA